jgi:hypothetical protein
LSVTQKLGKKGRFTKVSPCKAGAYHGQNRNIAFFKKYSW